MSQPEPLEADVGETSDVAQLKADLQRKHAEIKRLNELIQRDLETVRRVSAELQASRRELDQVKRRYDCALGQLERERYSVLRPIARRLYRDAGRLGHRLPGPLRRPLQRARRRYGPRLREAVMALSAGWQRLRRALRRERPPASPTPEWIQRARAVDRGKHDVIVFPVIDWHFRVQRPQHLAKHMAAAGHRVFYLSTGFGVGPAGGVEIVGSPVERVFLCRLSIPWPHPQIYQQPLRSDQTAMLSRCLARLSDLAGLRHTVAMVDLPFWRPVAAAVPGSVLVYDCMDYHAGFSTNTPLMLEEEDRLLREADLVITTSARLSEKIAEMVPNTVIRNAGEVAVFQSRPSSLRYQGDRPVVGYFGAIAEWFDIDLVVAAARHYLDWDFVLVGSTHQCDTALAESLPNVRFEGEVPYADLPGYLHAFDVCLIPFKLTELTLCTNPVKVYEYLAAGKPVVATALPELALIADQVHIAEDTEAFLTALAAAMAEAGDEELAASRAAWAQQHDWAHRAEQLDQAIAALFPKVSVIVLTYNNLELTRACLTSLERHTQYPDWELIIVDNASTDGSQAFLSEYATGRERTRVILNEQNLGFAAGNNVGLAAASGEYMVLLNNDTYVTPGWMTGLIRHLRRDPNLGIVGPVTNNIGNEAKIDLQYSGMDEMIAAAQAYTSAHARELLYARTAALFCAAIPRRIFEEIGGLDEQFGRGFFEDDDYCNRIRERGYQVAIADDVFVHHHLSASFNKLQSGERDALFARNKALYEAKWGPWIPHRYRDQ